MLPQKELNIYPLNDENVLAVIHFYFDQYDVNYDGILEKVKEASFLKMNQLEFIFRKLSEAYIPVFKVHLSLKIELTNLFLYALVALSDEIPSNSGSKNRIMITKEFKKFVEDSEVT